MGARCTVSKSMIQFFERFQLDKIILSDIVKIIYHFRFNQNDSLPYLHKHILKNKYFILFYFTFIFFLSSTLKADVIAVSCWHPVLIHAVPLYSSF